MSNSARMTDGATLYTAKHLESNIYLINECMKSMDSLIFVVHRYNKTNYDQSMHNVCCVELVSECLQ